MMNATRFTRFARAAATTGIRKSSTVPLRQPSLESASRLFPESRTARGLGYLAGALAFGQLAYGATDNVFEHKFKTKANPQDLADFYGTEDFMEIFCVNPIIVNLMMRAAEFQDDGTIKSFGLFGPKNLAVSIEFDERENPDDPETAEWFNKREHFKDHGPFGIRLWEITQNFGYQQLEDGTCEVYHSGHDFSGFFPMRIIFNLHSKYVIWATEKYVNSPTFGSEDLDDEREEIRHNVPLHVLREFLFGLSDEVQKAQEKTEVGSEEHKELQVTLQRLKTAVNMDHDNTNPQLRTYRTSTTDRVRLVLDDQETKDTIQRAMSQIGTAAGQRHEPVAKIAKLTRRATNLTARDLEEEQKELARRETRRASMSANEPRDEVFMASSEAKPLREEIARRATIRPMSNRTEESDEDIVDGIQRRSTNRDRNTAVKPAEREFEEIQRRATGVFKSEDAAFEELQRRATLVSKSDESVENSLDETTNHRVPIDASIAQSEDAATTSHANQVSVGMN